MADEKEDDLIAKAKKLWSKIRDRDADLREQALDDLMFRIGKQWPEELKRARNKNQEPCLTMNLTPKFVRQVTGDARQNKPSIEVHPVDSDADPVVAKILEGRIRNIAYFSNSPAARDTAIEGAANCGFGYYRVTTEYSEDDSFEQDIRIRRIVNQFSVYFGECIEPDFSDAKDCFVTEKISREDFKEKFGVEPMSWESGGSGDRDTDWNGETDVRYAEWWHKEATTKVIAECRALDAQGMPSDEVVTHEIDPKGGKPGYEILRKRTVKSHKVVLRVIDGEKILETTQWPGKYIPIIPVLGEELFIEGKRHLSGVIRDTKDPQRAYNYWWSSATARIALSPKAPWVGTAAMFEGHEQEWDRANKEAKSRLTFETDPQRPGDRPQREPFPGIPSGDVQMIEIASQGMKDTSGIYERSLGEKSNETSGRAIIAVQQQGDTGTFVYIDNLARAVTYEGKILVDLIPKIDDAQKIARVMGKNNDFSFEPINTFVKKGPDGNGMTLIGNKTVPPEKIPPDSKFDEQTGYLVDANGKPIPWNDLTIGKYDVVVSVGPSFKSQREQAADSMVKLVQAFPAIAPIIVPMIAKNLDWEGADDIAQKLEAPPAPPPGQPPPGAAPGGMPMPPQMMPGPGGVQ